MIMKIIIKYFQKLLIDEDKILENEEYNPLNINVDANLQIIDDLTQEIYIL